MSKIFLPLLFLFVIFTAAVATAGLWTSLGSLALKEVKPSKAYALDVVGLNVRVYEFDTQEQPVHHCILIFTESKYKAPVLQCWKKE
jgi:hypothetical protein